MPTVAASVSGGTPTDMTGGSLSFSGATGHGTAVTQNADSTYTVSVTSVAASSVVAAFLATGSTIGAISTGSERFKNNLEGNGPNATGNLAGGTNTGTGTVSVAWASGGASEAMLAVEVQNATFDAVGPSSSGASSTGSASLSWTHTPGGGFSGGVIVVGVNVDAAADGSLTCTVTYGGTAMASLGRVETTSGSGGGYLQDRKSVV